MFLETLKSGQLVVAAELRPPRAELASADGMDAWIDTYHAVRTLTSRKTFVFLTDSAVGVPEEDNLRHLIVNLGEDAPLDRVIPFLTSKHPLDYCLAYADRASQHGFDVARRARRRPARRRPALGRARVAAAAADPRRTTRTSCSAGGPIPTATPARQVDYLTAPDFTGEFYLTQVVSHHDPAPVERFLNEADRRGVDAPGVMGVFYYRSARPRTLALLQEFIPVPAEGTVAGVRRRGVAGGDLRPDAPRDDRARRAPVLREQPAAPADP